MVAVIIVAIVVVPLALTVVLIAPPALAHFPALPRLVLPAPSLLRLLDLVAFSEFEVIFIDFYISTEKAYQESRIELSLLADVIDNW